MHGIRLLSLLFVTAVSYTHLNSLGFHDTNYLLSGYTTDGWFYNYFPMPYWKHAKIIIENRSGVPVSLGFSEIAVSRLVDVYKRQD